jgi:hypothetical protein
MTWFPLAVGDENGARLARCATGCLEDAGAARRVTEFIFAGRCHTFAGWFVQQDRARISRAKVFSPR